MIRKICMTLMGLVLCGVAGTIQAANPRVVFMGDSIFAGWQEDVPSFFASHNFLNKGISGHTTGDMILRFQRDVLAYSPEVCVILAGTNDVAQNDGVFVSMEQICGNIIEMTEKCKEKGIKVVLCSVLPSSGFGWTSISPTNQIPRLNTLIEEYALTHDCGFVDFYSLFVQESGAMDPKFSYDNCHPERPGYYIMEQAVMPVLEEMLK